MLWITLRLFGCSEGTLEIVDAMEVAGYSTPERRGGTVYQRVFCTCRSRFKTIESIKKTSLPPSITLVEGSLPLQTSSISLFSTTNTLMTYSPSLSQPYLLPCARTILLTKEKKGPYKNNMYRQIRFSENEGCDNHDEFKLKTSLWSQR